VIDILPNAFYGCNTDVSIDENSASFSSVDGVLFNNAKTILINYSINKTDITYTIPDTVTSIGNSAFAGCNKLTFVTMNNNVKKIGTNAFYNCTSLTTITLSQTLTSISNFMLSNCSSLINFLMPPLVTSIGNNAFSGCSSLTNFIIPKSVTSIGTDVFLDCFAIATFTVVPTNEIFSSSLDGVLFNKSKTNLIRFPSKKLGTDYTIPNTVLSITTNAFSGSSKLVIVTIPDSVINVGDSAFNKCSALTTVEFLTTSTLPTFVGSSVFSTTPKVNTVIVSNATVCAKFFARTIT
jgi:hypothetical protein